MVTVWKLQLKLITKNIHNHLDTTEFYRNIFRKEDNDFVPNWDFLEPIGKETRWQSQVSFFYSNISRISNIH